MQIKPLTGLRFIAAFMVFACHAFPVDSGAWPLFPLGFNGVALFFTLSGFVICYTYFSKFSQNFSKTIFLFYRARFARVYPVYFLMALVYFFLNSSFSSSPNPVYFANFFRNLLMLQAWSLRKDIALGFNPVSWSVGVEIFFYLCFPFLVLTLLSRLSSLRQLLTAASSVYLALVLYIALLALYSPATVKVEDSAAYLTAYLYPLPHLADFLLGCITALIYKQVATVTVTEKELKLASFFFAVSLLAVFFLMFQPFVNIVNLGNLNDIFFAYFLFFLARYRTPLSRLLQSRTLVFLGEISYSFYLLHYFLLDLVRANLDYSQPITYPLVFLVLLFTIGLSAILYLAVELPCKRLITRTRPIPVTRQKQEITPPGGTV